VDDSFSHLNVCAATRTRTSLTRTSSLKSRLPDDLSLPCGGAPYYNDDYFVGRQEELDQLNSVLNPSAQKQNRFYTVWGLGGVGKSKLALAYAKRFGHQFDITLWIKAQNSISIDQSFTDIAIELRLEGARNNGSVDENRLRVFEFLKQNSQLPCFLPR
jgi:hypothetical protein